MAERRWLLALLTLTFALSHLDRQILNITLNAIGLEFGLNDVQLGALSGLAFAVIYVMLGFPVAKLALPGRRKAIVAGALGFWSFMTVLTGFAGSYLHLLLARIGVGVGEAGAAPPSHAMISAAYEPERRASALAVFSAGANIGIFLSFLVGGIVATAYGWRAAFFVAGAPGLLLAVVLMLKVREPVPKTPAPARTFTYRDVAARMFQSASTRHALYGAVLTAVVGYGAVAWVSTFLIRSHDLTTAQAGIFLAFTVGLLGGGGTWLGGVLADRLGARRADYRLKFVACTILCAKPFSIAFYLLGDPVIALTLFVVPALVGAMFTGPTFAHIYGELDEAMRPMATAVIMFLFNLIGLGLGPLIVGGLSDFMAPGEGSDSLRYALAIIQAVGLWGAVHFWIAGQKVKDQAGP